MDTMTEVEKPERFRVKKVWVAFVLLIVILGGGWILLQYFGPYSSLKREAIQQVGIERLQNWAISILDHPPEKFNPVGPQGRLLPQDVPVDIQSLGENGYIIYEPAHPMSGGQEHILFACGGGFYHYGIRVGRPSFVLSEDSQYQTQKLGEGVWGFYER